MNDEESKVQPSRQPGHRPCCDEDYCVRKYLDELADPEATLVDRIQIVACEVARTCHSLRTEELNLCAGRLFGLTPECDLTKLFALAYGIERDSLDGKKQLDKRRSAGRF